MFLYLLFFASSLLIGLLITEILRIHLSAPLRLAISFTIGTVFNLIILFFIFSIFGLNFITTFISTALSLILAPIFLAKSNFSMNLEKVNFTKDTIIIVPSLIVLILIVIIFRNSIFVSSDSVVAGNRLVWVDWPIHISFISSFLYGDNFPPQNPIHAGGITTYPFAIELLSAVLQSAGATLKNSLVVPGIILSLTLILLLYAFGRVFFEKRTVAIIAIYIGLFSGGLGFLYFFKDLFQSGDFLQTLFFPPYEYTFYEAKNLWFFTFIYSELLPQRAFLLGMPIFFASLILLVLGIVKNNKIKILLAAYLIAIMPFFHMHSYISAIIFSSVFIFLHIINLFNLKELHSVKKFLITISIYYLLPIVGLGLIQLPFFLDVGGQAFAPHFGWLKGQDNFFVFWIKNTGFFWPLWIIGYLKIKNKTARNILISSVSLFILPNIFRFAPWPYDNLKIFTYWYLIGAFAVSTALVYFWRKNYIGKILAIMLFLTLTLSGFLEIIRIINFQKTQIPLWGKDDIELSKVIIKNTEPRSIILTAAIHNHPVTALAGRKIIIGFPGNTWSWGFDDWQQRENEVRVMFRANTTIAPALFKKYKVDYVLLSQIERNFEPRLNEEYFSKNFDTVAVGQDYKLFKVK